MTKRLLAVPFSTVLMLLAACETQQRADLATNSTIYEGRPYLAREPGDRAIYVLPVADGRKAVEPAAGQDGFPVAYDGDARWDRPVDTMVAEVLQRELIDSGVFNRLLDEPDRCELILRPTLTSFVTGAMEVDTGGRSLAEIGLRIEIFGPQEASGQRPLLHDQVYGDRQMSSPALLPPSPYLMAGRALRMTMAQALAALDKNGLARSTPSPLAPERLQQLGIPAQPAAPAAPAK